MTYPMLALQTSLAHTSIFWASPPPHIWSHPSSEQLGMVISLLVFGVLSMSYMTLP